SVPAGQARVSNPAGGPKFALTVGDGSVSNNPVAITGGKLDVTTNGLVFRAAPGNETATLTSVRGQIVAGYNGGNWLGNGIVSSNAALDGSKAVGYALATEPPGAANGPLHGHPGDPA